jgi:hypothetical protein
MMPWITPIVFKQASDEALTRIPRFGDGPRNIRFRHIVHAYKDEAVPVNTAVQSITFASIDVARRFAEPNYPVTCVAVTYPEDTDLIPVSFVTAPTLQRVVTEIAHFAAQRPLPLLFDILRNGSSPSVPASGKPSLHRAFSRLFAPLRGARSSHRSRVTPSDEIEFLIMTNSDIHLQPPFYYVLGEFIQQGYDVITVNRRTIDVDQQHRCFSPVFFAERGSNHPGFDCFIFPLRMMEGFVSSDSCCGAGQVMRSLLFNLVAHARRFLMLTHAHLTFHLGDDQYAQDPKFSDYEDFNIVQAQNVVATLARDPEKAKRLADFIAVHETERYRAALPKALAILDVG